MDAKQERYFVIVYFNYTDSYHGKQKHFHVDHFNIAENGINKVNYFKLNSGRRDMAIKIESSTATIPMRNVENFIQSVKEKHANQDLWVIDTHRGVYTGEIDMIDPGDAIEKGTYAFAAHHCIRMEKEWYQLDADRRREILNQCIDLARQNGISLQIYNAKGLDTCDYQFWTEMENPVDMQRFIYQINSIFAPYSEDGIEFYALATPTTAKRINHVQRYP